MPILTRRRIQQMLDELTPLLREQKGRDLVRRLEAKRCEQAIPAEMELCLLWALSRLDTNIEIEPEWFGGRLPEAFTEAFLPGHETIVEILAISDGAMSGEAEMRSASQRLVELANRIKPGSGVHLYFHFQEESGYEKQQYYRRRKVPPDLKITPSLERQMKAWLSSTPLSEKSGVRLRDGALDVVVQWKAHKQHRLFNFHSSMPSETHSVTDNPIYPKLKDKARQLANEHSSGVRCLLLADAGCELLRRFKDNDFTRRRVSGEAIVRHFLRKNTGLDIIAVFSASRDSIGWRPKEPKWDMHVEARPGLRIDVSPFDELKRLLPPPRFSGYQARSLHQQGMFKPTAVPGWYVGSQFGGKKMKFSARALADFLAGRIDAKRFYHFTGIQDDKSGHNIIRWKLEHSETLVGAHIERGGTDKDDDHIVLEFGPDASAARFHLAETKEPADAE